MVSVDPHRLIMLYKFGYEMPGIYNQVSTVYSVNTHQQAHQVSNHIKYILKALKS